MSEYPEFMSDGEKDEGMFAFNPNASASSVRVGKCTIAVTVADNVLLRPRELADFGLGLEFVEDGSNLYPGVRARVPAEFSRPFCAWLTLFFFQAEDGIRDWSVTGVQTCALPI